VINFDETNYLVADEEGKQFLVKLLSIFLDFNKTQQGFVFCIFSGTNVRKQHDLRKAWFGEAPEEISLPILGTDQVMTVLRDLLSRKIDDMDDDRDAGNPMISAENEENLNLAISPENKGTLDFLIEVLGGVPCYVEMLEYALGYLNFLT
jgi:hypothetical protein